MFLHYINNNKFNIEIGDTLKHPANWDNVSFNEIVSNPPEGPQKRTIFCLNARKIRDCAIFKITIK